MAGLYSADGILYSGQPQGVQWRGPAEIEAKIAEVNQSQVQGNGFSVAPGGFLVNNGVLKVVWQFVAPNGDVVVTGTDVLTLDASGAIIADYTFLG